MLKLVFSILDPDSLEEVHELEFIKNFDLNRLPDIERTGEKYIAELQAAMEELYGTDMMAAMPEDRLKPCLLGVGGHLYGF